MLDYRTLLFISSQSPYFELFRPTESRAPGEGTPGSDVDVAIYGWGLHPTLHVGTDRLVRSTMRSSSGSTTSRARRSGPASREATATTRSTSRTTGSSSTRSATRRSRPFDHLVHLAELTTLAGVAFVLVLIGTAVFTRVAGTAPASAARCCARSAPASTASCSSRSCSPPSSRS